MFKFLAALGSLAISFERRDFGRAVPFGGQQAMLRLVSSPLVHFFALGALIFAVYSVFDEEQEAVSDNIIELTADEAGRLAQTFAATWRRPPTIEEFDVLMRNWVQEEANVREALALGLDRGDAVIRQRLNQKILFLAESGAAALKPDETTLQTYLDQNQARFLKPASIAFAQILLPEGQDATTLLAHLNGGADPATVGATSLLPPSLPITPGPVIDRVFGTGFHTALITIPVGEWYGPIQSGYGQHLVRVEYQTEAILPSLSDIRDRVEAEWRAAEMETMREDLSRAVLNRYRVSLPDAAAVLNK